MIIIFIILGILIGSFLNVIIIRLPRGEDFVFSRSHCMSCNYTLKYYDLIPIISYLTLGGRCRKCSKKISPIYPIVELINGMAYGYIYYKMGFILNLSSVNTLLVMFMFSTLLAISIIDFRELIIPDGLVVFICLLGLAKAFIEFRFIGLDFKSEILGIFIVSIPLLVLSVITRGGMGMGDVKLMAAAGFFLGTYAVVEAFVIGSILGGIVAVVLLLLKKVRRDSKIPFGPFLAIGIIITILFGDEIINLYFNLL